MGLHPWFLKEETVEEDCKRLMKAAVQDQVVAIGECGLDKVCNTSWALQEQAFAFQIELAHRLNKPLIIHGVRAFVEIGRMLGKPKVPVVFHGYTKSLALAHQLVHQGYYLSFGKALFSAQKAEVFRQVGSDRLFLETDSAELPIEAVYEQAAKIRSITIEEMISIVQQNIQAVFGINL